MIEFPEKKKDKRQLFKISKKSLCQECPHLEVICGFDITPTCSTDSKIGLAYVVKCQKYNELTKK